MSETMNPDVVKKALQRVKEHINNRNYDKARAILMQIDHPRKQEWLQRLEASVRREKANQGPKPWNPSFWASMTIVSSPLITSFILAWNWRRFGKKGWTLPTMGVALLLVGSVIGVALGGVILAGTNVLETQYGNLWLGSVMLLSGIFYAFPWVIAGRQQKALKVMEEKGMMAMRAHQYDWGRGMVVWALNVIVIFALAVGLNLYNSQPNQFSDNWISVEYPSDWSTFDVDSLPNCNSEYLDCRLFVQSRWGGTGVLFSGVQPLPNVNSADAVIDLIWAVIPSGDRIERGRYVISGFETKYAKYMTHNGAESYYTIDFAMVSRGQILYISIASTSEEVMDENWDDIKTMLDGMVWTP